MKTRLSKTGGSFLLATIMLLGTATSAIATSVDGSTETVLYSNIVMPQENQTIGGTIPSNSSCTYYTNLDSYIGFSKNFCAVSRSDSTSGALYLYLYKDGKLKSKDWIMGVNETNTVKWSMTLPSSGTWEVKVVASGTNAPVTFYGWWQN